MNYKRGNLLLITWFAAVIWGMINIYGASYALYIAAGAWPIKPIISITVILIVLLAILFLALKLID